MTYLLSTTYFGFLGTVYLFIADVVGPSVALHELSTLFYTPAVENGE